ncbi:MAG: MFS transporter [Candidatus Kerfeldbacteria bacterium CG15_BIG_FIL_POST_REV_8_21_14_020_45_12]|uniref:MFS transporter n=1 Tax=Candidatus Kerfeldbacteria bacterium CG15_BIG_FIL_POST_REV_8_21_14_020_45_12 TaxID=2014247 RepID=A0A2M7H510_9BACT|nr:MAG: MFS transporter [Candidatus Kerfeldbacteria bacterium CG15_BIG_FIL_POST_REV_8_21_14_020_45_12]PJA93194.1 MAG: MFS transporter [Candidatus Kerfeldbacteria bacterium CG_4_9_14_3_um_filter_45_8]
MSKKSENGLVNLLVNIAIPAIVLMKFSSDDWLGPVWGLIIALIFPFSYGLYDFIVRKERNALSIIGVVSIILTGGIGLLQLDPKWIAVKEAAVPLVIAGVLLVSMKTKTPLVEVLIGQVINLPKIRAAASSELLTKKLKITSYVVVFSFIVSAILNYVVSRIIVVSEPGSAAFTAELGRLTAVSYPFIALPSTSVMIIGIIWLIASLKKDTGLSLEDLLHENRSVKK